MNLRKPLSVLALTMASLLTSGASPATNFIVNSTADVRDDNPGDGVCHPINAVGNTCTLRAAIMEANANAGPHIIVLASGNYALTRTGAGENAAADGDLDISRNITITNGTSNPPVIQGLNQDRIFDVLANGTLRLYNINVIGGWANADGNVHGGGFRVDEQGQLLLERATINSNVGNIGGAIYSDGDVQILDSEFFNNGITNDHVLDSFANGAAILSRGTLSIERSTFRDNGFIPGGESLNLKATAYAIHLRNTGPANPSFDMVNVTVASNTRGIRSEGVPTSMNMSTIANNGGYGLRFNFDLANMGNLQLSIRQTVISGHTGYDCNQLDPVTYDAELDVNNRFNASSDNDCGFTGMFDHQNIGNPFFEEMATYGGRTTVLMPRPESVLVDNGGINCTPSYEDQREVVRPIDGNLDLAIGCDIGAVEYDPTTDPILAVELFKDGYE